MPNQTEMIEQFMKHLESTKTGGGAGFEFFKPEDAKGPADIGTPLRIAAPNWIPKMMPPLFEYEDRDLGLLGLRRSTLSAEFFGAPDPIADFINKNQHDPEKAELCKSLMPRKRWTAMGFKPGSSTLVIYKGITKAAAMVITAKALNSLQKDPMYNWPFDLKTGHNFLVKKTKENGFTKYPTDIHPRPGPVMEGVDLDNLQAIVDGFDLWAKVLYVETEDTLAEMLKGVYDKDVARERRRERDDRFGRPYPTYDDVSRPTKTKEAEDDLPPFEPDEPVTKVASAKSGASSPAASKSAAPTTGESKPSSIQARLAKLKGAATS